tara:strand:+ start:19768 stop:20679 length:912 start_codon:yes stop_codon:yes gene_type:complete
MQSTKSLKYNIKKSIDTFYKLIKKIKPKIVLIQGDTTTAAGCAYAGSLYGSKIAHNEAGLRTFDNNNPYPEELNRKLITSITDIHFAPTILNQKNLINEGIKKDKVFIVGNPGIDSFLYALKKPSKIAKKVIDHANKENKKIVFLTAHRRESIGSNFEILFRNLEIFFKNNKDYLLVTTKHPNNFALKYIKKYLTNLDNSLITKPYDYFTTCNIINKSAFVITDSGGIQEECATVGIPTVVCRKVTERIEAEKIGIAKIWKNKKDFLCLLKWAKNKKIKKWLKKPYGNGNSAKKISEILIKNI